jgi:hypothetical protein
VELQGADIVAEAGLPFHLKKEQQPGLSPGCKTLLMRCQIGCMHYIMPSTPAYKSQMHAPSLLAMQLERPERHLHTVFCAAVTPHQLHV